MPLNTQRPAAAATTPPMNKVTFLNETSKNEETSSYGATNAFPSGLVSSHVDLLKYLL